MAEQNVTLNPGESKVVSFEAIPHEAKDYQVSVNGLTGSFKATKPGLVIRYIGPSPLWDFVIRPNTQASWVAGTPKGIKAADVPATFDVPYTTFQFQGIEYPAKDWIDVHQITVPRIGEYAWRGEAALDGIQGKKLEEIIVETPGKSFIIGRYVTLGEAPLGWPGPWLVWIDVDEVIPVPGFANLDYLVGRRVRAKPVPAPEWLEVRHLWGVDVKEGTKMTCYLKTVGLYQGQMLFEAEEMREYTEYPPEAFNFSGSLIRGDLVPTATEYRYNREYHYQISGTVPRFAVTLELRSPTGVLGLYKLIGPGSGTVLGHPAVTVTMYAHPDPDKEWGYFYIFENWQKVASC